VRIYMSLYECRSSKGHQVQLKRVDMPSLGSLFGVWYTGGDGCVDGMRGRFVGVFDGEKL
jgi:hypothetical protein